MQGTVGLRRTPRRTSYLTELMRVGLTTLFLMGALRAEAAGIAGPNQTTAEGLVVLLGDPAMSGTGRASNTWRWRQIQLTSEPVVKFSHIDYPNTMFVAPAVNSNTLFRFELSKDGGRSTAAVDITVVPLGADNAANTTFIDRTLASACTTYDPATRLCGSGMYRAMKETFRSDWDPAPAPGRRYVFRGGAYPYLNNNPNHPYGCWPVATPILHVSGANGTPSQPIVLKAYKDPVTGVYERPLLNATGISCEISALLWVHSSSYVIVEGFTAMGAEYGTSSGRAVFLGGSGYGTGGINPAAEPVHHVTVRHSAVSHNGAANTWRGAFYIPGRSHEVLLEYIESFANGSGLEIGVPHTTDSSALPYNVFIQYALAHDNFRGGGNSGGILLMGTRNSIVSHSVSYRNSDGGGGSQGPFADDNVWEYIVTYGNDANLSAIPGGNERGIQFANVNQNLAMTVPYYSGGRNNLAHHIIAYDNFGNGINDAQGSHNGVYYHLTVFNNTRRAAVAGVPGIWGGLGFESEGGSGVYPAVTMGATLTNTIAFHDVIGRVAADPAISHPTQTRRETNLFSTNPGFSVATPSAGAESTLTTDTALYTDAARRTPNPNFGVVAGLKLQAGSAAIDRGTFVPGFHCDRADDGAVPYPTGDPNCVHWRGAAPDIGAYEYNGTQAVSSRPGAPTGLQVR